MSFLRTLAVQGGNAKDDAESLRIWIFPGTLEANEGWITWETRHLEGKVLNHFYKDLHQY